MEEELDASHFLDEIADGYDVLVGQYFGDDYCPTLTQVNLMYLMTDISTIEVPMSVKEMFEMGA